MKKLLWGGVAVVVLLMLAPTLISMAGSALLTALGSATSTMAAVSPSLAKVAFGFAALALIGGGILAAVGHKHGHKMIKGALLLAVVGAASGAVLTYMATQGPALAGQTTTAAGSLFQQAVQRLP